MDLQKETSSHATILTPLVLPVIPTAHEPPSKDPKEHISTRILPTNPAPNRLKLP